MADGDLTSLTAVKDWLGLSSLSQSDDDPVLTRLITAASMMICTWCNRSGFLLRSYHEVRDGTGSSRLALINTPVTAIDGLWIDGVAVTPSPGNGYSGYGFTPTLLLLYGMIFPRGQANIEIHYQAGLTAVPSDLEQVCIELVAQRFRERSRAGISTASLAGQSLGFSPADIPAPLRTVLDGYRRQVPLC